MQGLHHRLPSLTALASFEAAARHLSFKAAASELNVTPAAISRQIRNLEQELSRPLFVRLYRQVRLTPAGEQLFDAVAGGFGSIAATTDSLRAAPTEQRLTVGSTNAVASFWLLPRVQRFLDWQPEINVDHVISDTTIDMRTDPVDLAIRFGPGTWPGLESRYLFSDVVYPICGAQLAANRPGPQAVEDLLSELLLEVRVTEGWLDWTAWLRHHGVNARPPRARYFNNYVIAVQAAIDNQGYAIGWNALVGSMVDDGRLVRALPHAMPSPGAFFLVWPSGTTLKPEAVLFADWLQQEAADSAPAVAEAGS